jgi:hypothetical protein
MSLESTLIATTCRLPGGRSVLLVDLEEFGRRSIQSMDFGLSREPQHVIAASDLSLKRGELIFSEIDLAGNWKGGDIIAIQDGGPIALRCSPAVVPCIRGWLAIALGYDAALPDRNAERPRPPGDGTRGCVAQSESSIEPEKIPVWFEITMDGPVDDDIRVLLDGVPIFNPRRNLGWYQSPIRFEWWDGAQVIPPDSPKPAPPMKPGSVVSIEAFDGWATSASTSSWTAMTRYADGSVKLHRGGQKGTYRSQVVSPRINWPSDYLKPPGYPGYTPAAGNGALYGPWFDWYVPLGEFVL